jgi:hypothetical protein
MDQVKAFRRTVAAALVAAAGTAAASGDSGTAAMGEMQLGGAHLAIMVGGLVGLGVVVWLLSKLMSR